MNDSGGFEFGAFGELKVVVVCVCVLHGWFAWLRRLKKDGGSVTATRMKKIKGSGTNSCDAVKITYGYDGAKPQGKRPPWKRPWRPPRETTKGDHHMQREW